MNIQFDTHKLEEFYGTATLSTYAGGGNYIKSLRKGFKELEYKDGDWYYRDSYTGFFRSGGQEVVYYKDTPIFIVSYCGGMTEDYIYNLSFTNETFSFLKKALSQKEDSFTPRGPGRFQSGDFEYTANWNGNIENFKGEEKISYKGNIVFTHDFFGGIIVGK